MINSEQDLDSGFRIGMRCLAAGVSVLTAVGKDGERAAMTVSSTTSVSDNPPSLLVCVNVSARMDYVMQNADMFCINVLGAHQQQVSELCSIPESGDQRFTVGRWDKDAASEQYFLDDAPAVFFCKKAKVIEHGTHNIYVGDIQSIRAFEQADQPLIYAHGSYFSK